ncbi:tRNA (guanine-N7)-methyltransferase [Candidatus Methylacidiphilum infernorum]|uniref:tRNA (guanine-N(7)-)-methyltransferase n=1 Tax=Candidatus Methylacidiphilum infernorum TaxID=511746 RepID=A0ABX7PYB2_9BACT|nr:tRNA (guanine-N7)-methyltransferase [Candidatus Methylacidiphilum infernorum]QSR87631.1 tRNA (guanine-N7)-methyltransferase [Candidatus Methylacidiphilum infernorum]
MEDRLSVSQPKAAALPRVPEEGLVNSYLEGGPVDSRVLFGRDGPFVLDLGAGEGSFALAYALENPWSCVLAVEKKISRVRKIVRKVQQFDLKNLKVLHFSWDEFLKDYCKDSAVEEIHILFPDPWPKRRHHRRRTLNMESIQSMARVLKPGGMCRFLTDSRDYFLWAEKLFRLSAHFELKAPSRSYPESLFEKRFKKMGIPCYQSIWEKKNP